MKKLIFVLLACTFLLTSCSSKKENLTGDISVPKPLNENTFQDTLKLTKLKSSEEIDPEKLEALGFNRCILQTNGIRISSDNYRTDFKTLNALKKNIETLETSDTSYYIEVVSGPGVSVDRKNTSLFDDNDKVIYFSKMINEISSLNEENKNFKGIILNIGDASIKEDTYYNTLREICSRVSSHSKVPIIVTLHPLFFEEKDAEIPFDIFSGLNVGYNMQIHFECDSYPGEASFHNRKMQLNRNIILEKLYKIKSNKNLEGSKIMLSLKCPWNSQCSILVKDIFELMKIMGFEFSMAFSNTNDIYDFSSNKDILSILNKY